MLQVKKTLHVQGWCPLTCFVLPTSESFVQRCMHLTNQERSGGLHSHKVKTGLHLFLLWVFITCTSRTGQEVRRYIVRVLSVYSISHFIDKYKCFLKMGNILFGCKRKSPHESEDFLIELLLILAVVVDLVKKLILEEISNAVELLVVIDGYEKLFASLILLEL